MNLRSTKNLSREEHTKNFDAERNAEKPKGNLNLQTETEKELQMATYDLTQVELSALLTGNIDPSVREFVLSYLFDPDNPENNGNGHGHDDDDHPGMGHGAWTRQARR
jgi:hypothetical protein